MRVHLECLRVSGFDRAKPANGGPLGMSDTRMLQPFQTCGRGSTLYLKVGKDVNVFLKDLCGIEYWLYAMSSIYEVEF